MYNALQIGIEMPREHLYEKINKRLDQEIRDGLVDEVRHLMKLYDRSLPVFSGLVYEDIIQVLHGETTLPVALAHCKKRTRDYARRQMTWCRRNKRIKWVKTMEEAEKLVARFLKTQ